MRLFFLAVLLFYAADGYTVSVNSKRSFLFGDVLEPLCSVTYSEKSLSKPELIEMFHAWQNLTTSQIPNSTISDYRKAMPCFPGPDLNLRTNSNDEMIPPYPDCENFVNISKTIIEEATDLLKEMKKGEGSSQLDVSLKTVMNSLGNRLQNLIDYLPSGATKDKTESQLSALRSLSLQAPKLPEPLENSTVKPPQNYSNLPKISSKFNPIQLLNCFNISSFSPSDLLTLSGQTIGSIACSRFQICSFSDLSLNSCLSHLNITENQYNSVINKTIGELIKTKIGGSIIGRFFGEMGRFKRTPNPNGEEEYEDVTPIMKMDGREDKSDENIVDNSYGVIDSEDALRRLMDEEESLGNSTENMENLNSLDDKNHSVQKLHETRRRDELTNLLNTSIDGSGETQSKDRFEEALDNFRRNTISQGGSGVTPKEVNFSRIPTTTNLESRSDVTESLVEINETLLQEFQGSKKQGDVNFDQALNYFKNRTGSSEDVDLQNLLNTSLNSSMVEYGISYLNLNSTPFVKQEIEKILPELGNQEFTVLELLKKLNISDLSSLKKILDSIGPILGFSDVSKILNSSGIELKRILQNSSSMALSENVVDTVNTKLLSKSPESSQIINKLSESSTLPTAIQNALKSKDTMISSVLSKLNL